MEKKQYIEQWKDKFKQLNDRKPTRLETMAFRVGYNAGLHKAKS